MARQLLTARLQRKLCLSEPAQCFHLEFTVNELPAFDFAPGQFVSMVADDANGKSHTRAYSIASAMRENQFDLCVNRVPGGFFSNLLCDLEPGQTVPFHGPHGLFLLRQPLTDGIFIATGTGIAPMRGFTQHLFPDAGPHAGEDLSGGREFWLVYGTRYPTELYYADYFEQLARDHQNFHYLSTLSRPEASWTGRKGYVQEFVAQVVEERAAKGVHAPVATAAEPAGFDIHAYICGLNEMVSATRERLMSFGWQRKQVIFERYD